MLDLISGLNITFQISTIFYRKLIRKNKIKVNKKKTKTKYRVQLNDEIEVFNFDKIKHKNKTEIKKYKPSEKEKKIYGNFIIENNDNFIVINKPAGYLFSLAQNLLKIL